MTLLYDDYWPLCLENCFPRTTCRFAKNGQPRIVHPDRSPKDSTCRDLCWIEYISTLFYWTINVTLILSHQRSQIRETCIPTFRTPYPFYHSRLILNGHVVPTLKSFLSFKLHAIIFLFIYAAMCKNVKEKGTTQFSDYRRRSLGKTRWVQLQILLPLGFTLKGTKKKIMKGREIVMIRRV